MSGWAATTWHGTDTGLVVVVLISLTCYLAAALMIVLLRNAPKLLGYYVVTANIPLGGKLSILFYLKTILVLPTISLMVEISL